MTAAAVSIAFFDPEHGLSGVARSSATILFEGSQSRVLAEGPEVARSGGGWRAELAGAFSLHLEPVAGGAAALDGVTAHVCAVTGSVGTTQVRCLGTVAETTVPPAWDQLDAVRSLAALFDAGHGFLAIARRPRGARGHDQEEVTAWLLRDGKPLVIEETRLSTVYDGDGRQRNASLELWVADEDFPRRIAGTAVAGSSLQLEGVDVHAAVFGWRMEGREGAGAYELWVRQDREAA